MASKSNSSNGWMNFNQFKTYLTNEATGNIDPKYVGRAFKLRDTNNHQDITVQNLVAMYRNRSDWEDKDDSLGIPNYYNANEMEFKVIPLRTPSSGGRKRRKRRKTRKKRKTKRKGCKKRRKLSKYVRNQKGCKRKSKKK